MAPMASAANLRKLRGLVGSGSRRRRGCLPVLSSPPLPIPRRLECHCRTRTLPPAPTSRNERRSFAMFS